jgi:uncharacterized protein YbgA (DUF1722 family)/uncharacterized protein YbbK (DUF523 family)
VRYDGSHRRDRYVTDVLARHFAFVPVCPETECGLGVPRPSMRLVGDPDEPDSWRLTVPSTGADHTERMLAWARTRLDGLAGENLCGFIFKSKSPSSGMERVAVFRPGLPQPVKRGKGLFAREFLRRFPTVPAEEEGRLNDPALRENFVERVFALHRWRSLLAAGLTPGGLVDFHTRHKLLVRAHSPQLYRELGAFVARAATPAGFAEPATVAADYEAALMRALAVRATPKKHADVLLHVLGHFKKRLEADEKREFLETVEAYKLGHVPLIVPVTLANHYVRKYAEPYLARQHYLRPHPAELALRNHA